jgi:flagellar L-ring protein FlgH
MQTQLKGMLAFIGLSTLAWGGFPCTSYAESLWLRSTTNERGMFSDRKAYRIGDVLKVIINISSATDKAGIKLSRDEKRENSTLDNPAYQYFLKKAAKIINANVEQSDMHSTSAHKGSGEVKIETLDALATFTVTVIDVLPNKNLVLEGSRQLKIADQLVFTSLRGIARADDISRNNEIDASKIADMHFEMLTEGSITDVQGKGIVTRLNDVTNLF